jgi:hypothetical protein
LPQSRLGGFLPGSRQFDDARIGAERDAPGILNGIDRLAG